MFWKWCDCQIRLSSVLGVFSITNDSTIFGEVCSFSNYCRFSKKKKRSRTFYLFVYFFPNLGPQELMHMSNRNGCMCYVWGFCICAHEHVFTLHYSFCPSRRSFSLRPCPARLLSPQPSVNSAGNRAKPTTWEWTLLRTSRKSLLLSLNKEEGVGDRHCNRVLYSFGVMVLKRE